MAVHVSTNTPSTSAVELYQGSFYQALGDIKDEVCQWHSLSNYRLAIISAGYGLLDAREPAHEYDIKMSGKIARAWREFDLVEIIAELILKEQAEKIFGFFAGSTTWNHAGSKYRFFFTEGLRLAAANGYRSTLAGCFYRKTHPNHSYWTGTVTVNNFASFLPAFILLHSRNLQVNYAHFNLELLSW